MYGRSAVYQAIHSNSIASVISLDLAMQSLYDGRYNAVYMPDYSIGPMVNESECQMTRSNTRPSQARFRLAQVQPRLGPAKPGPA